MVAETSELTDSLPRVVEQLDLLDSGTGFAYVTEPDRSFVMPDLRRAAGGAVAPSVILVEARAAVGKSMLSRHLAWLTGAPLWDLSQVYVGSGTLWGSLARAFGPMQLNSVIGRMLTGEFVLIIDALDEAEMHALGEAFDAFLIELRDMFATRRSSPGVVILGRSETIEYVELFLGNQFPVRRYRILDFDEDQAYEFVDNRLDFGPISEPTFVCGAHRKRELVYIEARNRLFDFLADRILPTPRSQPEGEPSGTGEVAVRAEAWSLRARSFLGYAPVLETIAEYLASYAPSYRALIADLGAMESNPYSSGNAQWKMLATIVEHLLRREQRKVITQLRKVITTAEEIDWTRVYTPDEQCGYVLGRVAGSQALLDYLPSLPSDAEARYRDLLRNALSNHPFLGGFFGYANVVFRDYVHAWGLLAANAAAQDAVRTALHAEEYLPSPLLGPFMIIGNIEQGRAGVKGQDLGFVYESLLTQGENRIYIYREPGEPADVFIGEDPTADTSVFEIVHPDEGIHFWRRLGRASIRGELAVKLGLPGGGFSLGPDVTLEVGIVEVPCRAMRVYTRKSDGHVIITASTGYIGGSVEAELHKFGDGDFSISWEAARYPWIEFAKQIVSPTQPTHIKGWGAMSEAYINLVRIARTFNHGRGLQSYWGPIVFNSDNVFYRQTRNNKQLGLLFEWLVELRIIVSYPRDRYYLDSRQFLNHGVTVLDIFARQDTPALRRFVKRFLTYAGRR